VTNGEVGWLLAGLGRLGLLEVGRFAEVVVHQLLFKGFVGSLGEHRLFLKDGQDTHGLCKSTITYISRRINNCAV